MTLNQQTYCYVRKHLQCEREERKSCFAEIRVLRCCLTCRKSEWYRFIATACGFSLGVEFERV